MNADKILVHPFVWEFYEHSTSVSEYVGGGYIWFVQLIICGIGGMMINNDSGYKFNPGTMMTHGTSMGLWHPALNINKITAGISVESLEC